VTAGELRGQGRWAEAVELVDDPLERADILSEQALFSGDGAARTRAARELDRAEALLLLGRGRILHAEFLRDRQNPDPRELELFERARACAQAADDRRLEGWADLWLGIYHQVVADDGATARDPLERAYAVGEEHGDRVLMSYATRHLAWEDDADRAWERWEESVRLRREEGFLPGVAAGLFTLGEAAAERGRPEDARRLFEEARDVARRSNASVFLRLADEALASLDG
jgi:tetratricopeptide (TPR) repeat protein